MLDSQLRPEGVTDAGVLQAMLTVPREDHVPDALRAVAYADRTLSFGDGSALMSPAALGRLLTELRPKRGESALVVGKAPGYSAAILSAMGLDVDTASGAKAPARDYDLILIDGAVEQLPETLGNALRPGGRIGGGLVERGVTRLAVGQSAGDAIGLKSFADADIPVMIEFSRPAAFTF